MTNETCILSKSAIAMATLLTGFQAEAQHVTLDKILRLPEEKGFTIKLGVPTGSISPDHYLLYTKITPENAIQLTLKLHSDGDGVLTPGEIVAGAYRYAARDGSGDLIEIGADTTHHTQFACQTEGKADHPPLRHFITDSAARREIVSALEQEMFDGLPIMPRSRTLPPQPALLQPKP